MTDVKDNKILNSENIKSEIAEGQQSTPEFIKKTEAERQSTIEQHSTEQTENKTPAKFRLPQIRRQVLVTPAKDEMTIKVEKILEEGLSDAYNQLSPIAKQEFKIKGEKTAAKISELLRSAHVKVKKIIKLIIEWLRLLPGINKFFLEQEAKIKTDKILALKDKQK